MEKGTEAGFRAGRSERRADARAPEDHRFVDLRAFQHLARGLTFDVVQCAEVLDHALCALNKATGYPDRLLAWISAGGLAAGPCPMFDGGRLLIDVVQAANRDGKLGYFATVLSKADERETAPAVFLSMHSPTLDLPMRTELPLRALLRGNPPLAGTYTLYLHALLASTGQDYIYYGVTKRGWNLRFGEHTRAAVAQKSKRLLARALNDLIDARVAELSGVEDARPKLRGLVNAICGVGLTKEAALEAEEALVDKYSLASKHPCGLNMIPGGLAGARHARRFSRGTRRMA